MSAMICYNINHKGLKKSDYAKSYKIIGNIGSFQAAF